MNRKFLGDSYDAVKRLWCDILRDWAPLYADGRYIPAEMRKDFTRLTGIPILEQMPTTRFSVLNDPDTGVRLPDEQNQRDGRTHISIATIARQLRETAARCAVTFDQSDYRHSGLNRQEQRRKKMQALRQLGIVSFYYVSHAPFLFAFQQTDDRDDLKALLIISGIPKCRLEDEEQKAEQSAGAYG